MRFWTIILSFYIALLSIMPCSDVSGCNDDIKKEISHTNSDVEDHTDFCTPFCSCTCCGANVVFIDFKGFSITEPVVSNPTNPVFNQTSVSSFNHSIWQPPKI